MLLAILAKFNWGAAANGAKNLYEKAEENPDTTASVIDFVLALVVYAIIAAVIGAIAAAVGKFVFDKEGEDLQSIFLGVGGVVLVFCVICYFAF